MSTVNELLDLTLYGCPLHYIKARESLRKMELEDVILLRVNKGKAVDEVLNSLRHDGQQCDIEAEDKVSTLIKVTKKE